MKPAALLLLALLAAGSLPAADKLKTWKAPGKQAPVVSFRQPSAKNAARELSIKLAGKAPQVLLSTLGSVKTAAWSKDGGTFVVLLAGRKGGTELFLFDRQGQELRELEASLEKRRLTKGGACMKPSKAWKALKMKGNELSLRADRCGKPRWLVTDLKITPKRTE